VHRGRDAAIEWSGKSFDHLIRRYVPRGIEQRPGGAVVDAELQYAWRESGEVGDRSGASIELGIRDGQISSWRLSESE
jgi:hypothetical protein